MTNLNFKTDILPFMIATVGEWAGLYYWLQYLDAGKFVLGNVILWGGFLVERLAVILWLRFIQRPAEGLASPKVTPVQIVTGLIGITLPEIIIWIVWLALADGQGYLIAGVALAFLMLAEHSFELGVVKRKNPMFFLTHPPTLFFTAMEVLGAIAWLHFVRNGQPMLGGAVLLVSLSIEHIIEGATLKKKIG